jgi:hypothetical protein
MMVAGLTSIERERLSSLKAWSLHAGDAVSAVLCDIALNRAVDGQLFEGLSDADKVHLAEEFTRDMRIGPYTLGIGWDFRKIRLALRA